MPRLVGMEIVVEDSVGLEDDYGWRKYQSRIQVGKLSIICCYQVCKQNISSVSPKTAFSQQWSLLKQQGQAHPNPRKQFTDDLDQLLLDLTNQGNTIVLAGDFNATIGDDPHGIDRLIYKYNLVDTIQHLHGSYSCATYS